MERVKDSNNFVDFHRYDAKIDRLYTVAKEKKFSKEIFDELSDFDNFLKHNDIAIATRHKILDDAVNKLWCWKPKPFKQWTKKDVEKYYAWLGSNSNYALRPASKNRIVASLKKVFDEYLGKPKFIENIHRFRDKNGKKKEIDVLAEEDAWKIVKSGSNFKEQSFLAVLWESGARIASIANVLRKDVKTAEGLTEIKFRHSKIGESYSLVLQGATHYLEKYISSLPTDSEMPLWLNYRGERMGHNGFVKIIRNTTRKAGFGNKYRVNPHFWRHSRATFLASKLTEAELCSVMNWKIGSKEASTYVHFSNKERRSAMMKVYGLEKPEERKPLIKSIQCKLCNKTTNNSDFCSNCHNPITETGYRKKWSEIKQSQVKNKAYELALSDIMKNINIQDLIREETKKAIGELMISKEVE